MSEHRSARLLDGHRPAGSPKGKRDPVFYEPDVVEQILGQCSKTAATGVRDMAFLAVTWRAALRADCEALSLKPADIDGSTVRVLNGKGGKARNVQVSTGCIALLDRWIAVRRELGLRSSELPVRHPRGAQDELPGR
jgi:integrase